MKINLDQLRNHLNPPLKPLYIVMGDEPLLVDETCRYLKKIAKKAGYNEHKLLSVTARFNWQEFSVEDQVLSLFSTKKIIELHLLSGKPGKVGAQALLDFSYSQSADTLLLLRLPKLTVAQQKSKWYSQLEQRGLAIQIWPVNARQFPRWLQRRLQRAKLSTSAQGIKILTDLTEGNLLAAQQSIEKLSLLYGEGELSIEQITECLNDNSRFDIYALLEACLQQDSQRSLKILENLYAANIEPSLILWLLQKELSTLIELAHADQQQQPLAAIWKKHGVWQSRQASLIQHMRAFSYVFYQQQLKKVAICDHILKGASPGNIKQALQELVIGFNPIIYREST